MSATIEALLEADEREARRDTYRAAGGSKRRPLKSFMTAKEKRDARDEHAERIHAATDALATPAGFEAWLEALGLNSHLSPMNAALVALQTPGETAASVAGWKRLGYRVQKGEVACGRLTAPGFWPLPYFTAAQAGADELDVLSAPMPEESRREGLRAALAAALASGVKPRLALEAIAKQVEAEAVDWAAGARETVAEREELPF